MVMNQDNNS